MCLALELLLSLYTLFAAGIKWMRPDLIGIEHVKLRELLMHDDYIEHKGELVCILVPSRFRLFLHLFYERVSIRFSRTQNTSCIKSPQLCMVVINLTEEFDYIYFCYI